MTKEYFSQIKPGNILVFSLFLCCFLGYFFIGRGPRTSITLDDLPQDIDLILPPLSAVKSSSTLKVFRGKPLLIYFWATWCQSCKQEYPRLVRLSENIQDPKRILAVATFDQRSKVLNSAIVQNRKLMFAYDGRNRLANGLGLSSIPQTYVFDGEGALVRHYRGSIPHVEIERIREVLCPECN